MEMELDKFMEHVEVINKDLAIYKDTEKGMMFYMNTIQLLVRVEALEYDKEQYNIAKFEKKVQELDYAIKKIKRVVPKYQITKDEKDKYTLIDKKVDVKQIWNVSNASGVYKSFVNKDEALEYA